MKWDEEAQQENEPKGMKVSFKILLATIVCLIIIIILMILLLININRPTYSINFDGKSINTVEKEELLTKIDNKTYVNIQKFADIIGYKYYDKKIEGNSDLTEKSVYVQSADEKVVFYLNSNKVLKQQLINNSKEQYGEYTVESKTKNLDGKVYATLETIKLAFNVTLDEKEDSFKVYTLDYIIDRYNKNVINWGYTSIENQSFENKKALLYGYIIVKQENGLYKVIDLNNTKEIVSANYTMIEFSEYMQEFYVTSNTDPKMGIINLDGTIKIEPTFEHIEVLDKKNDLYLIKKEGKYGVINGESVNIIVPEYDAIGTNNKYLLLETLIPVSKEGKWGAYNKNGERILELEYDEFGYNLNSIEIDGAKENVQPVIELKRANAIVVRQGEKYGLLSLDGEILVRIVVDSIYAVENEENEDNKYFMVYNGEKLNIIEKLILANKIEKNIAEDSTSATENINEVNK